MEQPAFMALLNDEAIAAQQAEIAFRNSISDQIAQHERERQFAFRRIDIIERMIAAAGGAETRDDAVAAQRSVLKAILGWNADTEARLPVLDAWSRVAEAVWRFRTAELEAADAAPQQTTVPDALKAFEAWYLVEFGTPFLAMLDQEVEELPVVEF